MKKLIIGVVIAVTACMLSLLPFFLVILLFTGGGIDTGGGGIRGNDLVRVALAEVKEENNGGQKFWSFMGWTARDSWCAAFVSWCADQCGYIESGIIPKSGWCNDFRNFYKEKNQWKDGQAYGSNYVPKAGDLIVFQWSGNPAVDLDHIGIVTGVEGLTVFTVEGNSGDAVKCNTYAMSSPSIIGYCTPTYPTGGGALGEGGYPVDSTAYTEEEMNLIYACIQQEDNGSYEGALAVISCVMNRVDSPSWSSCGSNALEQITAPGQFCYSIDTHWQRWLNGNVYEHVKQAVDDCLKGGIRNHDYSSFRSTQGSATGTNGRYIPEGGNYYF